MVGSKWNCAIPVSLKVPIFIFFILIILLLVQCVRVKGQWQFVSISRTLTHLCSSGLFIGHKPESLNTVRHIVTCDPLVSILSTLSGNTWHTSKPSKVDLEPLAFVLSFSIPRPSKPTHTSLVQSGISWGTIEVVIWRSSDELVRDTAVFHSKRNIALTLGKTKMTIFS